MNHSNAFLSIVEDAKSRIQEIDIFTVKKLMEHEHPVLIDVREDREWDANRIVGAIHIGKGVLERDIQSKCPDQKIKIILYCGGGYRSVLAADNLQKMGYENVFSMKGGIRDWCTSGFPVESV